MVSQRLTAAWGCQRSSPSQYLIMFAGGVSVQNRSRLVGGNHQLRPEKRLDSGQGQLKRFKDGQFLQGWPGRPLSRRLRHCARRLPQGGRQFNQRHCRNPRELRIVLTLESRTNTLPVDQRGCSDEGGADGLMLPRCCGCTLSRIPIPRAMQSKIGASAILNFDLRIFNISDGLADSPNGVRSAKGTFQAESDQDAIDRPEIIGWKGISEPRSGSRARLLNRCYTFNRSCQRDGP